MTCTSHSHIYHNRLPCEYTRSSVLHCSHSPASIAIQTSVHISGYQTRISRQRMNSLTLPQLNECTSTKTRSFVFGSRRMSSMTTSRVHPKLRMVSKLTRQAVKLHIPSLFVLTHPDGVLRIDILSTVFYLRAGSRSDILVESSRTANGRRMMEMDGSYLHPEFQNV